MRQTGAVRRANGTAWPTMLAARIAAFVGWRRYGCAAALGALAVAAMPPWHFIVVLPVAFGGLVWLIDGCGAGRRGARIAFLVGWCFGLGHFAVGLYWVVNAPLVYGFDTVAMLPLVPIISIGLPALLGLFPAAACLAAWWLAGRLLAPGAAARVLLLAAFWTGFEWLRGNILTGFPWQLAGYVCTGSDAMLQLSAHVGIYGLSLLTVAAAAMPAVLAGGPAVPESPRRRWAWAGRRGGGVEPDLGRRRLALGAGRAIGRPGHGARRHAARGAAQHSPAGQVDAGASGPEPHAASAAHRRPRTRDHQPYHLAGNRHALLPGRARRRAPAHGPGRRPRRRRHRRCAGGVRRRAGCSGFGTACWRSTTPAP